MILARRGEVLIMLRITAIGAGAVDYLIRGSGCCAEHEHGQQLDAGRAELRQRANAGEQKAALARAFGISRETLYQYLKRAATLGHEVSRERAG